MTAYKRFIFLSALLLGSGWETVSASEYPPLNNLWPEAAAGSASNHGNPWRTQKNISTAEAQFAQPSGNPWLEGGRSQQRANAYPQQAPQMMPRLPQRGEVQAWSSPQRFPFGWMP